VVNRIESTFAALSDPTRFQVIALLRSDRLSAGELARKCGMSGPAMSRHLRILRRSGLVEVVPSHADSDARVRVYRLRPESFFSLKEWSDHMQSFWTRQLAAFKQYAEHKQPQKKRKGPRQ
jgi:DNA-binding transcriptional ArsR family regulator